MLSPLMRCGVCRPDQRFDARENRRMDVTAATRPGEWVESDAGLGLSDIGPGTFNMRIDTDRYTSRHYAQREREAIWMRVWQIAGRVDELPRSVIGSSTASWISPS
jgi:hypothetical protein